MTATTTVQKQVQREHCPFIAVNPEIKRIKTATLKDSKAQTLVDDIYKLLEEYESLLKIKIIGTDSCPKMTGHKGGSHALLEARLGRALFRILCMLHTLEVLWKCFFHTVAESPKAPPS